MDKIITLTTEEEELYELACVLEIGNLDRKYIQYEGEFFSAEPRTLKEVGVALGLCESYTQKIFVSAMNKLRKHSTKIEEAVYKS
jgi:hypothetical protein